MFTRGCLLGLLLVPATWLLAAWMAWPPSGPAEPKDHPQAMAGSVGGLTANPAIVQRGILPAPRSGMENLTRPEPADAVPPGGRSGALQQCTRYILDLLMVRGGETDHSRPVACSRVLVLWTRDAMNHLVGVLGPFAAWTRHPALSSGQRACSDRTVGKGSPGCVDGFES